MFARLEIPPLLLSGKWFMRIPVLNSGSLRFVAPLVSDNLYQDYIRQDKPLALIGGQYL
jgi:hypothetical protein